MKTIILAGGFGTRLGNLTESIPKPMLKIGNKPILWHIMKTYSFYGYNDFIISLGYKADVIKEYFLNYKYYNSDFRIGLKSHILEVINNYEESDWNISLVDTGLNTLKGARIKRLETYLDEINMVTYGDGVADININELVEYHLSHKKIITISGVHPPARFGELIESNSQLVSFNEKPQVSTGFINGGYMVFNKELLGYLTTDEKCDLEFGTLEYLAQINEIMVYKHEKQWACVDTERELVQLNDLWNQKKAFWKCWNGE